ncbi:TadE/TadG family type IV pilus assembly protein [Neobacillus drentensis]|uniref:TadE/TadG family type IV pilus assembly protein n=1 Tax=Neobacillus drentensis TaxID=220684 RepID=UPI002FFD88CB
MQLVIKKILKEERGNALIFGIGALVILLGVAGFAIDGSLLFMKKSQLQKEANAAVLSGSQELTNTEQKVKDTVQYILNAHKDSSALEKLDIEMGKKVAITLKKSVKLTFASLFGFEKIDVKAHAATGLTTIGKAVGAAPLGIDESIPLEYYKTYLLKVDSSGVTSGNFGVLALSGPGAKTYEQNLRYGYQDELKMNDIIDTQTGNIAGSTRSAINERVIGCSQPPGDYSLRNCSRILLIPVYKPYSFDTNQLKSVKITGFAYFYITDPMSSTDTSIKGVFIKRAGQGSYVEGSKDRGAYSIRLTE